MDSNEQLHPKSESDSRQSRPLSVLLFLVFLVVLLGLQIWRTYSDYRGLVLHHADLAEHVIDAVSNEISGELNSLIRGVQYLAELDEIPLSAKDSPPFSDLDFHQSLQSQVDQLFGGRAVNYALSDLDGNIIAASSNNLDPQTFRVIINEYVENSFQQNTRIFPGYEYFPLIAPWPERSSMQGLLMVNFSTHEFIRELGETRNETIGYELVFLRNGQIDQVELKPDAMPDDMIISIDELSEIHFSEPILGSQWQLTSLPRIKFFKQVLSKLIRDAIFFSIGLFIVLLPVFGFFYRHEKQQKETQINLWKSETRFRRFFEKLNDPLLIVNPKTDRIIDANEQASDFFGYTHKQLLAHSWLGLHLSELELKPVLELLDAEGSAWTDKIHCITSDERIRPVEVSASLIHYENKPQLVWRLRDIDEQKRAAEALQSLALSPASNRGEQFIKNCLQQLANRYSCEYAYVGTYDSTNHQLQTLHFWSVNQFDEKFSYELKNSPHEAVFNKNTNFISNDIQNLYPHDECLKNLEIQSYLGAPLVGTDKKCIGVLAIFSKYPITIGSSLEAMIEIYAQRITSELEREAAYTALQENERNYRELIENSLDAIVIHRGWRPVYANPAWLDLFGYQDISEVDAITSLDPLFPEYEHERLRRYREARARGDSAPSKYEVDALHKSGKIIVLQILARRTRWKDKNVIISICSDITEQKLAMQALADQQDTLEKLVIERTTTLAATQKKLLQKERLATIGRLVATVSHELRNPLGAVRNAAYYLKRKVPKEQPRWQEYLDIIDKEVNAADMIISDLLETTRAKLPILREIDLEVLLQEVLQQCTRSTNISSQIYCTPSGLFISADRDHLRQVLMNLVTNAVQAMGLDGEIVIAAMLQGETCIIRVEDNGPGIDEVNQTQVFEPLFTTKSKGNGLGLWISKEIIERHGGKMSLDNNHTDGTCIVIELPINEPQNYKSSSFG